MINALNKAIFALPALFLILSSCETEPDVLAPYKEQAVVYGLLNQKDSIQIIEVGKVFLGSGNAYDMAQQPDSINYPVSDIVVTLEALNSAGSIVNTMTMNDTVLQGAQSGTFNKSNNVAYYTRDSLSYEYNYRFRLRNLKTGYECTSTTPLVKVTTQGDRDTILLSRLPRASKIALKLDVTKYATLSPTWTTIANGRDYQVTLRFHYKEYTSGNDTVYKYIDWKQAPITAGAIKGGEQIAQEIKCEDFFKFLQTQKEGGAFVDMSVNRKAAYLEIFMSVGGDELSIYSKVSKPSSTVIYQERPYYSNVKNGLGILSCRYITTPVRKAFDSTTLREFAFGQYTSDLNFKE